MQQWTRKHENTKTRKHEKPSARIKKIMNQSLQHGSFFINTGKTGKWRKEFHLAISPVIVEEKRQTDYTWNWPVIHAVQARISWKYIKLEGSKIFGD